MEPEITCEFETAEQFWKKLDDSVSQPCDTGLLTDELVDNALRSYLALTTGCPEYVKSDNECRRCAYKLYSSPLFAQRPDYIRTQLVHCFLQDDESDVLHITSTFLLADALEHESTFELLNNEGAFQRMIQLIGAPRQEGEEGLHRLLMELFYEMARIQKITNNDLMCVDDEFICRLFGIIEGLSGDVTDPYHYPVIRVLLVLNEQYMVAAHDPAVAPNKTVGLTNRVIKVLASHGSKYKTFGENIILLLNREDETSLQLLTLKLLYLLFTTPSTYEYFYTNDLHVLVDILVRNLLDLPEEAVSLRHTYLRVLYPLLEHTQLHQPPHYKRNEIRKLLLVMAGHHIDGTDESTVHFFEDVDDTTKRLVKRCQNVSWIIQPAPEIPQAESPIDDAPPITIEPESPSKISKAPPALPAPRKLRKRNSSHTSDQGTGPYLNPQLEARQSSLSMMEMAAQKEKPGVKTPSRNPSLKHGLRGLVMQKKEKPPPPKSRRSDKRKDRTAGLTEVEVANAKEGVDESANRDESTGDSVSEESNITRTRSLESKFSEIKLKKPPLPPTKRRWRSKRGKEEEESELARDPAREPGKFNPDLPSIITINTDQSPEQSPFSPPPEKTLSPDTGEEISILSKGTSSVSAALGQAQMQAIHNIEETLENAHIKIEHTHQQSQSNIVHESPPLQRAVLAPPGQAPLRGVPGPTMELERSPFLSDNDSEERIDERGLPKVEEQSEEGEAQEEGLGVKVAESDDEWNYWDD